MKRLKRKQLKEDEFVSIVTRLFNFAKRRKKEIVIFMSLIVFSLLLFLGQKLVSIQSAKSQNRLLKEIIELSESLEVHPENIDKLIKLGGRGKFSRLAFLKVATYWSERGEFEKALQVLERVSPQRKDIFYFQAQDLKAQIFLKQNKPDKAIEIYAEIERKKPKEYPLDAIYFNKAKAYEEKGDLASALTLYKKLKDEFAHTYYGFEASLKMERLERR